VQQFHHARLQGGADLIDKWSTLRAIRSDVLKVLEEARAAKTIGSIVRTAVAMEGQNQADEHMEAKEERLDSGKVTENIGLVRVMKPDVMRPKE
jgi:isoleucyl-tRNA synthetase